MSAVLAWFAVEANRRRVYGALVILLPLVVAAGYLSNGTAQQILAALAVLLGGATPALARKHTKKKG